MRSRSTDQMSWDILLHTSEEIRHSIFFKRQAMLLGGNHFQSFAEDVLLCSDSLKKYFYEIDILTVDSIKKISSPTLQEAAYLLVTWLVERRALSIYATYEDILKSDNHTFSLSGILKEEKFHLQELGAQAEQILLDHGFNPKHVADIEKNQFEFLWARIERAVEHIQSDFSSEAAL